MLATEMATSVTNKEYTKKLKSSFIKGEDIKTKLGYINMATLLSTNNQNERTTVDFERGYKAVAAPKE